MSKPVNAVLRAVRPVPMLAKRMIKAVLRNVSIAQITAKRALLHAKNILKNVLTMTAKKHVKSASMHARPA